MRRHLRTAGLLLAGVAALALSVRGWHAWEMAVLGAGISLRVGFDLGRLPPRPRRAPRPPAGHPDRPVWSEGAARVAAWTRDRRVDPTQIRLDHDWLVTARTNNKGGNP